MARNCILDDLCPIKLLFLYFRFYNKRFTYRLTLPRALGKGAVSSCDFFKLGGFRLTYFFLAISFFLLLLLLLTICFFFHMLYPISTKLGQNDYWVSHYKSYQQFDLKGHVRVTEVKKVILKENATPPTWFIGFWRNLVRITSRQVATKVINSLTLKVM